MSDKKKPDPLGPTGRFPQGKLDSFDRGEFRIGIGIHKSGKLVLLVVGDIELGFYPNQAEELAEALTKFAAKIRANNPPHPPEST